MPFNVAIGQLYLNHRCYRLFTNSNNDAIRDMIVQKSILYVVLVDECALDFVDETADERIIGFFALALSLVLEILNSEMLRV